MKKASGRCIELAATRLAVVASGLVAMSGMAFGQAATRPASAPAASGASPPVAATPGSTDLGDLELIPVRANLTLYRYGNYTCNDTVVRFRVRNKSAGDLKLILYRANFAATDASGGVLFRNNRDFAAGGIAISEAPPSQMQSAFTSERGKLVSIAPRQIIEVQMTTAPGAPMCVVDVNEETMRNHRPKTMSLSASLGVVDVSGATDVKSVSLLDVPLQVGTR